MWLGSAGDIFVFAVFLIYASTCLLFAVVIPKRLLWSLRHGRVGINRMVIRKSEHPIIFWLAFIPAPYFWWICVRTLAGFARSLLG